MTAPPQSSSRPRMIWRETEQMRATLKPWGPSQWGVRHRSVITAVAVRGVALQRAVRRVVDMQTWARAMTRASTLPPSALPPPARLLAG